MLESQKLYSPCLCLFHVCTYVHIYFSKKKCQLYFYFISLYIIYFTNFICRYDKFKQKMINVVFLFKKNFD